MRNKALTRLGAGALCAAVFFASSVPVHANSWVGNSVAAAMPAAGASYFMSTQNVSLAEIRREYGATVDGLTGAGAGVTAQVLDKRPITETEDLSSPDKDKINIAKYQALYREESGKLEADLLASRTPQEEPQETEQQGGQVAQLQVGGAAAIAVDPERQAAEEAAVAEAVADSGPVIAYVNDYVNVREEPSTEASILGKFYDGSVGEILGEENGWYLIESGSLTGYVKAEFCKAGAEAEEMLPYVTRQFAYATEALNVRAEANTDAKILETASVGDSFEILEEYDEWVKVVYESTDTGYLYKDYISVKDEYLTAESREEEEARLAKAKEREEARLAELARQSQQSAASTGVTQNYNTAVEYATSYSDQGAAVAAFALQFVGNPYVWGGSSLTNGADCSGFTMAVYQNFGVSLPHGSYWQLDYGTPVASIETAAPGDLIIYRGHVALYIGGGQIVHASTSSTGIIVSSAYYDSPIGIRRIFQ